MPGDKTREDTPTLVLPQKREESLFCIVRALPNARGISAVLSSSTDDVEALSSGTVEVVARATTIVSLAGIPVSCESHDTDLAARRRQEEDPCTTHESPPRITLWSFSVVGIVPKTREHS